MNAPPTLHTKRLILRPFRLSDAKDYYEELASRESVTRYMLFRPHKTMAESEESMVKIQKLYAQGGCYRWAVTRIEEDRLIGTIALLGFDHQEESCSFAYMLGEPFWGQGYGTEMLEAALDYAFSQLSMKLVKADHFSENGASGAVMRKVGMIYTGTVSDKYEKNGKWHDALSYQITLEDFRSRC